MIVLTNDDGIQAPGIRALWKAMDAVHDVVIVAPESEQSAVGHAITLSQPIRVRDQVEDGRHIGYAVSGTPADCVKIAVTELLDEPPELVVSGINQGGNLGTCAIYSGTVSAATEAAIMGIPSIAVSLDSWESKDFSAAAGFVCDLLPTVLKEGLPEGVALNINVPAIPGDQIKGVSVTRQGKSRVIEAFDKRTDPRNNTYYWLAGEMRFDEVEKGTDCEMVNEGYISVTPIQFDLTSHPTLDALKSWNLKFFNRS